VARCHLRPTSSFHVGYKALLLQAVLFGLWHFGTDYVGSGGNLLGMFVEMVTVQMTLGLARAT
jgi:hypothetical protein